MTACSLYRMRDARRRLLYVGITTRPNGRLHEVDTGLSVRLVAAWSLHALTAQVASAGSLPREPQGPGSATVPAPLPTPTTSP